MQDNPVPDFAELVRQYDELRASELDLLNKRHAADKELQLTRFRAAELAARIARASVNDVSCW
jgi:hypothetical protein